MTTSPDGPQKSLPLQEIDAWVLTAQERHAALTIHAARAGDGSHLQEAFAAMAALAQDALTTLHVLRKQLREASQAAQARSIALHDHHTQILEQSLGAMERLAQFLPPSPEAIRQAESRMLEMFQGELNRGAVRWAGRAGGAGKG